MKKLVSVLLVLGAVVMGLSAQNKKVIAAQIEEIKKNGEYVDENDKRKITVSFKESDNGKRQTKTACYNHVDFMSKTTKAEVLYITSTKIDGINYYNIRIQIFSSNEVSTDYARYFAIFYGSEAEQQLQFKKGTVKTNASSKIFTLSGEIEKSEFEKLQRANSIQIVLTNDSTFYDYEQSDMGLNNFTTNKLFQTVLKDFFKDDQSSANTKKAGQPTEQKNDTVSNSTIEFDEETKTKLEEIKSKGKYVEKDGEKNISVLKSIMKYPKPGSTIYDEPPAFPTVIYRLNDSTKNQELLIRISGTPTPNKYNVTVEFLRHEEFPNDFGTLFSIFLNNSFEEKINFNGKYPTAKFGVDYRSENGKSVSYNKYYVTGSISKNELEKLKTAQSILIVIGSDGDIVTENGKQYMSSSANMFPNKLFSAALAEYFNYE